MKGLNTYIMPYLAQLYKGGKTTIKQIAFLTEIPFIDVITSLSPLVDDIQIDPQAEQYSQEMGK